MRVKVKPEMLRWACERAGLGVDDVAERVPQLPAWTRGEAAPTLKQLEHFARTTHAPIGYLFLLQPPEERVPIPDFRTVAGKRLRRPSPDLLETIYICEQRQEWYRDFARSVGERPLAFVGSAKVSDEVVSVAARIRAVLGFDDAARRASPTWVDALRRFIEQAEAAGVLVMASGVVLNNNRRRLDPQEFRGFALADGLAPVVFINGADTKAAQMFTLAHELAHVWLGQSALSDAELTQTPSNEIERWCNQVAAEVLVPLAALRGEYQPRRPLGDEVGRIARIYKVSTLVVLRRIHDIGGLTRKQFWDEYSNELARLQTLTKGSGGNFYLTQAVRAGKRFTRALIVSTLEGQTLHRDALRLLGFSKMSTFHDLGRSLSVA